MKPHKKRQLYYIVAFITFFMILHLMYSPYWGKLLRPYEYREEINFYSNKYNLDPKMVAAVIYVESRFKPEAISPKGATGLMQIMPETAKWAAPQISIEHFSEEMLLEPAYNIHLGTWYLSTLLNQFEDSMPAALAAYNGGRNRVKRWLNEGTWDGDLETADSIPINETREYVERVFKAHSHYERLYD